MAHIYSTQIGQAAVLMDPRSVPITVTLGGWSSLRSAVLQSVSVGSEVNAQFMRTLRNFTYAYLFGEKMGTVVFSGVLLDSLCGYGISGTSNTIGYYANYGMYYTGSTVSIVIGAASFSGFLVKIALTHNSDPERHIGQFDLFLKTTPPA